MENKRIEVRYNEFRDALYKVSAFTKMDVGRPVLEAVKISVSGETMTLEAIDGYKACRLITQTQINTYVIDTEFLIVPFEIEKLKKSENATIVITDTVIDGKKTTVIKGVKEGRVLFDRFFSFESHFKFIETDKFFDDAMRGNTRFIISTKLLMDAIKPFKDNILEVVTLDSKNAPFLINVLNNNYYQIAQVILAPRTNAYNRGN